MNKPLFAAALFLTTLLLHPVAAQNADAINAKIRAEGMERSQIMHTLHMLTDRYGPRLTGSPNLDEAGEWAMDQMTEWGLENANKDPWDFGHIGWLNERFSAHILSPVKDQLTAEVLAWTPSTNGTVISEAVHLVAPNKPTQTELDAYLNSLRDQVEGRIVFVGDMQQAPSGFRMPNQRRDDDEVDKQYRPDNVSQPYSRRRGSQNQDESTLSNREVNQQVSTFLVSSGAAVRVDPARMDDGLIRAFSNRTFDPTQAVPTVILRNEDYGRITRLMASDIPVTLEFSIVNRMYPEGRTQYNYIAEIPGTDLADEVIMIGGHLDSWHAATGATDNAAGSSVMMEAVRILKAIGAEPRRTIRVALWSGEEQGLLGSQAYVKKHFGTFEDPTPAYSKFGGYINVDSGTGKLRGATVFGPVDAAKALDDILTPFEDLGMAGARPSYSRSLGGSDHTAFNQAGLPGISMGQDPIRYFTHTWHTNLDTYERILEEDMKQAAVVVAASVLHLANADDLLPRFGVEDMPANPADMD